MIIDTIEISGIFIPYSDIKRYSIVYRNYIYRPEYREKNNFISKAVSMKKYDFVQMIPYAAVLSEKEYDKLLGNSQSDQLSFIETMDAIGSIAAEQVVDYITNGSMIANAALKVADFAKEIAVDKISSIVSKDKYCYITPNGKLCRTTLGSIPSVLVHNNGQITEADKIESKLYLPGGHPSVIQPVSALHITTTFQSYLFFGNGINIYSAEQMYSRLEQELAYRGVTDLNKPDLLSSVINKFRNFFEDL